MWEFLAPFVGGLLGDGKDDQTSTSKNEPWAAAQPFMLRNLQDTEKLGNYYKANPFNKQQIESYSNLFSDNNNFRSNIAPGLMNFANAGMSGGYQRATGGRPGDGAGYGGARQPGGRTGGLLSQSAGPFSVGQSGAQSGGLLDLNVAQNPFANGGITQNPQGVTEEMITELKSYLSESPGNDREQTSGGGSGGAMGVNDAFHDAQMMINTPYGAMTVAVAASLGLLGNMKQDPNKVPVENRSFAELGNNGGYGGGYGGEGVQGPGGYGVDGAGNPGIGGYGFQ